MMKIIHINEILLLYLNYINIEVQALRLLTVIMITALLDAGTYRFTMFYAYISIIIYMHL